MVLVTTIDENPQTRHTNAVELIAREIEVFTGLEPVVTPRIREGDPPGDLRVNGRWVAVVYARERLILARRKDGSPYRYPGYTWTLRRHHGPARENVSHWVLVADDGRRDRAFVIPHATLHARYRSHNLTVAASSLATHWVAQFEETWDQLKEER